MSRDHGGEARDHGRRPRDRERARRAAARGAVDRASAVARAIHGAARPDGHLARASSPARHRAVGASREIAVADSVARGGAIRQARAVARGLSRAARGAPRAARRVAVVLRVAVVRDVVRWSDPAVGDTAVARRGSERARTAHRAVAGVARAAAVARACRERRRAGAAAADGQRNPSDGGEHHDPEPTDRPVHGRDGFSDAAAEASTREHGTAARSCHTDTAASRATRPTARGFAGPPESGTTRRGSCGSATPRRGRAARARRRTSR